MKTSSRYHIAHKDIKFFGKNGFYFKEEDEQYWEVKHTSTQDILKWYKRVRFNCQFISFSFDLSNPNSFGVVMIDNVSYLINPPIISNGDLNWEKYSVNTDLITRIYKY